MGWGSFVEDIADAIEEGLGGGSSEEGGGSESESTSEGQQ